MHVLTTVKKNGLDFIVGTLSLETWCEQIMCTHALQSPQENASKGKYGCRFGTKKEKFSTQDWIVIFSLKFSLILLSVCGTSNPLCFHTLLTPEKSSEDTTEKSHSRHDSGTKTSRLPPPPLLSPPRHITALLAKPSISPDL